MGILDRLFGGSAPRISANELGRQFAGVALRSGFADEHAVVTICEAIGIDSDSLDVRREILAFTAAPLEVAVFGTLDEATANRFRESLLHYLVEALKASIHAEYQGRIDWQATAAALSMRISEYRFMLLEEEHGLDTRQGLLLLSGRAYRNITRRSEVDPQAMVLLASRYQLTIKNMRPVVKSYRVD